MNDPIYAALDARFDPQPTRWNLDDVKAPPRIYFERIGESGWYSVNVADIAIIDSPDSMFDTLEFLVDFYNGEYAS